MTADGDGTSAPDGENARARRLEGGGADTAVVGSFVGEVSGTKAFVAVVAAPAQDGQDAGAVQIYISDGRGLSEWFSGPISDGGFAAESDDGDAEAEGTLSGDSVTGTVVLPDGKTGSVRGQPAVWRGGPLRADGLLRRRAQWRLRSRSGPQG